MTANPIVESVREVPELKGALHINMSCGHKLLRWGRDWSWQPGHAHLCEACMTGESEIVDVLCNADLLRLTLLCPGQQRHHIYDMTVDDVLFAYQGVTRQTARATLMGTTWRCPICHPIDGIYSIYSNIG